MRSIRAFISAITFIVLGIVLIVISATEMTDYSKKGASYSSLEMSDYKEGMMVEGYLPYNYGSYEYIYDEDDKDTMGYYYLIDAGEDGFMGLYTPIDDLIKSLDNQSDEYYAASTEAEFSAIAPVKFKGKVTKMDSDDQKYFKQVLSEAGYTDEYIASCPQLYIKCVDTSSHPFMLIIGIVVTVIGLVLMLLFIRRKMMGR